VKPFLPNFKKQGADGSSFIFNRRKIIRYSFSPVMILTLIRPEHDFSYIDVIQNTPSEIFVIGDI